MTSRALASSVAGLRNRAYVRRLFMYIHWEDPIARKARTSKTTRKVSRTFRLTPGRLEAAQKILGTETATATIETALDMVVFRQELIDGADAMFGADIDAVA